MPTERADASQSLSDQYDHGDATPIDLVTSTQSGPGEPLPRSNEPPQTEAASQPRDPETGKFVSREPAHNPRVVRLAGELGFTPDEIKGHEPAALEAAVDRELRYQSIRNAKETGEAMRASTQNRQPPVQAEPAPVLKSVDEDPVNGIDPSLVRYIRHLESKIDGLQAGIVAGQQLTVAQQADSFFGRNAQRYGDGTVHTLAKDSPHRAVRDMMLGLADKLGKGLPVGDALAKAESFLFGAPTTKPAAATAPAHAPSADDFRNGGLFRPTNRMPQPETDPTKRAVTAVNGKLAEYGLNNEDDPEMPA